MGTLHSFICCFFLFLLFVVVLADDVPPHSSKKDFVSSVTLMPVSYACFTCTLFYTPGVACRGRCNSVDRTIVPRRSGGNVSATQWNGIATLQCTAFTMGSVWRHSWYSFPKTRFSFTRALVASRALMFPYLSLPLGFRVGRLLNLWPASAP